MEEQTIDQGTVKQLERLLGDNFQVLVSTFEEDAIAKVSSARHHYNSEHWSDLFKIIHSLKGACLNMGANKMVSLCKRIETALQEEQFAELDTILVLLESQLVDLKVVLQQLKMT